MHSAKPAPDSFEASQEMHPELVAKLIELLLAEMPRFTPDWRETATDYASQRRFLRGLMNVRPPAPLSAQFLEAQNQLLRGEAEQRGVVEASTLPGSPPDSRLNLWQGDITQLEADAIVNAANSQMLGCFGWNHACIDNAIHSAAGLELRQECYEIMTQRGRPEPTGTATLTGGYCLPAKHVIHTVGPIIEDQPSQLQIRQLQSCYQQCLELAASHDLHSVGLCAISTGVFRFPKEQAAQIAVQTTREFLAKASQSSVERIVFVVFNDRDYQIYQRLLHR